jgi:hypothetical protein
MVLRGFLKGQWALNNETLTGQPEMDSKANSGCDLRPIRA